MKRMKLFLALLLSFVLLISSSLSALADGEDPGETPDPDPSSTQTTTPVYENVDGPFTLTINANHPDDKGTHTYDVYQIFTGTLAEEKDDQGNVISYVLSDIVWGSGLTDEGIADLEATYTNPYNFAKALEAMNDNQNELFDVADDLSTKLSDTKITSASSDGDTITIEIPAPGYYLIQDADTSPNGNIPSAKTRYILRIVADQKINVKSSVPSVEKKVKETNDTTGYVSDWQDAADYDIGDSIPYKITAVIGDGIEWFDGYSLVFYDTLSPGLTLEDGWTITIITPDDKEYIVTDAFTKE